MNKKLKVVYVANSGYVGGGNKSLLSMAKKLKENDHNILILLPHKGDFSALLERENLRYKIISRDFNSKTQLLLKIIEYLIVFLKYSPDIFHANDLFSYFPASIAAYILNIPSICHFRYSVDVMSINYFMKPCPDALIFNSEYMKNMFPNIRLNKQVIKKVIYNFFDPEKYFLPEERTIIRKKFDIDHSYLVGMIANFSPQKGFETFIYMAQNILKKSKNFRFLIVGKDLSPNKENEVRIKKLIKSLKLDEYFIFTGFQENVAAILSALDVLVVPSEYEPFGRVAVEGLLAGLPVVASKTGGLVEILNGAPYAYLVEPSNYRAFAEKVYYVCKNMTYPLLDNHKYAVNRFSASVNFEKLTNLYNQLIS